MPQAAAPELLEVIVLPHRWLHHVDDDRAQINQDPLSRAFPLDALHRGAGLLHFLHDVVRQGPRLPRGVGTGDDHAVKQGGQFGRIQNDDIAGLDIFERRDGDFDQPIESHPPPGVYNRLTSI